MSGDLPTYGMIHGWLINWLTDSTVRGLTNWPNYLWLVDWLTDLTYQLTKLFIAGSLTNWLYFAGTNQWLNDLWMIDWLTD